MYTFLLYIYIQQYDTVFAYNQINDVLALWFWLIEYAYQIDAIHKVCTKITILTGFIVDCPDGRKF